MHGAESLASTFLVYCILLQIAAGSVWHSRIFRQRDVDGIWASAIVGAMCIVSLISLAVVPSSPLLGVSGGIIPSPWLRGLFPALCVSAVATSVTFGLVSGNINSLKTLCHNLTYGIGKCPGLVLLSMFLSAVI